MKYIVLCLILNIFSINATYSVSIAQIGWQFSNAAYCRDELITKWDCSDCSASGVVLTDISLISNKGQRAFCGYAVKENAIYVSIMGTHDTEQWMENLEADFINYPNCQNCKVHQGFYNSYEILAKDLRFFVMKLKSAHSNAKLRVFGHSLGGAISVLVAADFFASNNFTSEYVYTFGQPRVGNTEFSYWYNSTIKNHFRVTHHQDPVPHLPPKDFGYHHTGREIFYEGSPPNYILCDGSGEDKSCSNQYMLSTKVNDHLTYMVGECCCGDNAVAREGSGQKGMAIAKGSNTFGLLCLMLLYLILC